MRGAPPGRIDQPNPSSPDIQVSRFETFLRRLLSIKRAGLVTRVDPQFSVSTDPLSNGFDADQQLALGWRRYGSIATAAAVAAQNLAFVLTNPAGSGVIAIVELLTVSMTAVSPIRIYVEDAAGLAIGGGVYTGYDSRLTKNATGIATASLFTQIGTLVPPFNTGRSITGTLVNGITARLQLPYVLTPGNCLVVDGGTVLLAGGVECVWRERAAEASELAIA